MIHIAFPFVQICMIYRRGLENNAYMQFFSLSQNCNFLCQFDTFYIFMMCSLFLFSILFKCVAKYLVHGNSFVLNHTVAELETTFIHTSQLLVLCYKQIGRQYKSALMEHSDQDQHYLAFH